MSLPTEPKNKIISIPYLCAAGTDVGRLRDNNEDTFVFDPKNGFFMVVDGMGGHAKGEVAAQMAAETIQTAVRKIENTAPIRLRDSIILANNSIFELAFKESSDLGCVLTALLFEDKQAFIGHIGDTRLYLIKNRELTKLTTDHSVVGQLEAEGDLSEQRLLVHPRRNEVTRCVGIAEKSFEDDDFVDVLQVEWTDDLAFLLCSDGLSDLLTSAQILQIVEENAASPPTVVEKLIAAANQFGGKDNITVIFICGREFANEIAHRDPVKTKTFSQHFLSLTANRWAFLLYGIVLGGLGVFWYLYRIFSVQLEVSPP